MVTESPSESHAAVVEFANGANMEVRSGNVSVSAVKVGDFKGDKALNERLGRHLKMAVFAFAAAFSASLLFLFWRYCMSFMHGAEKMAHSGKAISFDWHIILLAAFMIIPATATILVLARSIFTSTPQPSDESVLPTVTLLKELLEVTKSITK